MLCKCGAEVHTDVSGAAACAACLLLLALQPWAATSEIEESTRLLGPIGRGPHGTVYQGVRPDDDPQLVTVKVIDAPTDVVRFCEGLTMTGSALDSLRHPAVAPILGVGTTGDGHACVMAPYIPSLSLLNYLNGRPTDAAARARLAGRLCSAVADLHDAGVVHGSLKPTNVIVLGSTDGPWPILLDTGTVTAIEYGLKGATSATAERDCRELHRLIGDLLGDLTGVVVGTESAAVLADIFSQGAV
jgi:hypothetical protein